MARAYFDAAARAELVLPRCRACGARSWPPRAHCPACEAMDVEWTPSTGNGRIHTFTVVHRPGTAAGAAPASYVVAMIELDEGPRLMSRVIDCDPAAVHCGMGVAVAFADLGDGSQVPVFRPLEAMR